MTCPICDQVGGPLVECRVCGLLKRPIGRSVPLVMENARCDYECSGYREEPLPSELWPGERYGDSLGHFDWHEEVSNG